MNERNAYQSFVANRAVRIALICGAYVATARLGLSLGYANDSITAVWAPSGIALAALTLGGIQLWPGVALGAFLANIATGGGLLTVCGITVGNTLEAIVAVTLLNSIGFRSTLDRLRDVVALVLLAATISTAISATLGTLSLRLGGTLDPGDWAAAWRLWWLGDMSGDLLVAPVLLILAGVFARPRVRTRERLRPIIEGGALLTGLGAISVVIFSGTAPLGYLVFPILIVTVLRLGQLGAVLAAFLVASIAVPFTANGIGPFAQELADTSLLLSQTFVSAAAVTGLVLGAITNERTRARRELEDMIRMRTAELDLRNRQLSEAWALDRAKDEVVALVSHDLRTPLTSIRGYTELLLTEDDALSDRGREYATVIDRNGGRLLDLVDDLLVVAQHNVGAFAVRTTDKVDLTDLVHDTLVALEPLAAKQGITLTMAARTATSVPGDRARLARLIENLVTNAIKYTGMGGVVVVSSDETDDHVLLRVRDNGPGIPAEEQKRIFDRFERVRGGGATSAQGFGLGLTIARAIAEAHSGSIGVESAPGAGATFWVELPTTLHTADVQRPKTLVAP